MALTFAGAIVVPVADPDDGERTAAAIAPRFEPSGRAILVHVVEKGGGAIDKAPVDRQREYAEEVFERARRPLADADVDVDTDVRYGADVVETIFDGAVEANADAVAFVPREANRLAELLTGDVARRLVKEASVPVVAVPEDGTV